MAQFSQHSITELETADLRLQMVFNEVIKHWDCQVLQGKRTEEEQRKNVANGKSKTFDSKHVYPLNKPSMAVDVAPYPIDWKDTNRFYAFGGFVIGIATMMGVKLRWGGDWDSDRDLKDQTFFDLVHFELAE